MIDWLLNLQLVADSAIAVILLGFGFAKRKPSLVSLSLAGVVEIGLIAQFVASTMLVVGGAKAKTDTVEFFAYLVVALMIPAGAAFWALVERTRWSIMVLGVSAATAAIMLGRMQQIWLG